VKTFLFGLVAAAGVTLGVAPQQASAYWAYRTAYRFDPACGQVVAYQERYWVPEVYFSSYPYVGPVYYREGYGPWYRHHHHHHDHPRHHHHHHH
jgi:hypothetical protein